MPAIEYPHGPMGNRVRVGRVVGKRVGRRRRVSGREGDFGNGRRDEGNIAYAQAYPRRGNGRLVQEWRWGHGMVILRTVACGEGGMTVEFGSSYLG